MPNMEILMALILTSAKSNVKKNMVDIDGVRLVGVAEEDGAAHHQDEHIFVQTISLDEGETATCTGYEQHSYGNALYCLLVLLTMGVVHLINSVQPKVWLIIACRSAPLSRADVLLVQTHSAASIHAVQTVRIEQELSKTLRILEYRYNRFVYSSITGCFETCNDFYNIFERGVMIDENFTGTSLPSSLRNYRRLLFGRNLVNIAMKSIPRLLIDEVLHPFYLFQLLSIGVWMIEAYYYYATAIFLVSAVSIASSLVELRQNLIKLRSMARHECDAEVLIDDKWVTMSSSDLVPGDLFAIPQDDSFVFPCDALLLTGSCIVNEAMLTGESTPLTKSAVAVLSPIDSLTAGVLQTGPPHMIDPAARSSKRHHVYAGTCLIQTLTSNSERAVAFVVRTGFDTAKGQLIRSILFPKPNRFTFYRDSFRFIAVMGCVALLGFFYSLYTFISLHAPWQKILLRFADLITVAVPPALPVAMTVGTSFALSRLKRRDIYCVSPPRVNVAGRLNMFAFDKTGTLTEDDLKVVGVLSKADGNETLSILRTELDDMESYAHTGTKAIEPGVNELLSTDQTDLTVLVSPTVPLRHLLATTHSLLYVRGSIIGDPIDMQMLKFSNWIFEQPSQSSLRGIIKSPDGLYQLQLLRSFDFDSAIQRMSVLIFDCMHQRYQLHVKGAPEMIKRIAVASSIPSNYDQQLAAYANQGYRIIALGYKLLPQIGNIDEAMTITRDKIETEIVFAGLLIMENPIKPATIPSLAILSHAHIRTIMITGDNILTGSSVARQCGLQRQQCPVYHPIFVQASEISSVSTLVNNSETIVMWERMDATGPLLTTEQLAARVQTLRLPYLRQPEHDSSVDEMYLFSEISMTGDDYERLKQELPSALFHKVLLRCQVYARMLPNLKKSLIEDFQGLGFTIGMCGDGANDCGALRAADVGLSLSAAEASVAASFSSREANIGSVLQLIKEGRAALVTSFACFKYMSFYAMIQTVTVSILYGVDSNLADFQFLFIDLIVILPLSICMALTSASDHITSKSPTGSLLSPIILVSLFGQVVIQLLFQVLVFVVLRLQSWYVPLVAVEDGVTLIGGQYACQESTTLFLFSCYLYMSGSIVFSIGPAYRKSIFSNLWFMIALCLLAIVTSYLVFFPDSVSKKVMDLVEIPLSWRAGIFGFAVAHFIISFAFERYVFPRISARISARRRRRKDPIKRKLYKQLVDNTVDE